MLSEKVENWSSEELYVLESTDGSRLSLLTALHNRTKANIALFIGFMINPIDRIQHMDFTSVVNI